MAPSPPRETTLAVFPSEVNDDEVPLPPPTPRERRYRLESVGDNLAMEKRIDLKNEVNGTVWSKQRTLTDEEVIDVVRDSQLRPRWTIHRPRTGWYLSLESLAYAASLPRNTTTAFHGVNLKHSGSRGSQCFTFSVHSVVDFNRRSAPSAPNSPRADANFPGRFTDTRIPMLGKGDAKTPSVSHFLLQPGLPHGPQNQHRRRKSSNRFSISSFSHILADRGKTFSCVWLDEGECEVLRYEDEVSLLSLKTQGNVFLNESVVDAVGMDPTFWVTVVLAYLDFLEGSEAYTAAKDG